MKMATSFWLGIIFMLSTFMMEKCQQDPLTNPLNNSIQLHMRLLLVTDDEYFNKTAVQLIMYHVNEILSKQINLYLQVNWIIPGEKGIVLTDQLLALYSELSSLSLSITVCHTVMISILTHYLLLMDSTRRTTSPSLQET